MDTLGARIKALRERVPDPETGKPYTQRKIVQGLVERDIKCSFAYFNQLERGERDQPNDDILSGLASFWGVSSQYFDLKDDVTAAHILQQLDLLALARDGRFQRLMTRAGESSGNREELIVALLEAVDEAEKESRA